MLPSVKSTSSERQRFMARYKIAKARADEWASLLEACFYYAVPFRNRFYKESQEQGGFNNAYLYDSTGVEATRTFVSKMHNVMCPPQVQWGFMEATSKTLSADELQEVQLEHDEYLDEVFRYTHNSNFDVVVNEAFFDLSIGTSCLVCNHYRDDDPLLFTSIPIDQLAIEEALDGRIHSWFRTWKEIKISQIPYRWKNARLSHNLQQMMDDNPNAKIKVVEGVTFNPENQHTPYTYSIYAHDGDDEAILEAPMKINRAVTWRFQKTNNEWWGRGPVMDSLPAIMRANEMAKIEYASANLNVFRPFMGFSDNIFNPNTFRLRPMEVIPIAPVGSQGQIPLIPLPDSSNPVFGQMTLVDLRTQINNLLFSDPLGPVDGPAKTATELALRQQDLAEKIGPLFTRLQQEMLWPILNLIMHTLDESGILPRPKFEGVDVIFKYKSPLAQAKGLQEVSTLSQAVQVLQGILGPDVVQLFINNAKAPYKIFKAMQVDLDYLNTPDQVKAIGQQMLEAKNQMQAAQEEAMKNQPPQGAPK
jgi:hypothetical protein